MKTARFAATVTALLFIVGCGGVDVGGVPVDVGGLNFNGDFNFGDIDLGTELENELLNGLTDELAEEPDEELAEGDDAEELAEGGEADTEEMSADEDTAKPHPADADGNFAIDNDELLAYGVAFQNNELPEGQDESWLDVAVSIWQARADGAYFDDMESPEPLNWQAIDDDQPDQPGPHPADTDADFLLTSEEVLAYASSFQSGELPEGQDESWLDVAVSIWQARADGAYFDDMESPEPLNWKSMDESGVVTDDATEEIDDDEVSDNSDATDATDDAGEGYDILFKVTPLSPVSFNLTVIDPTEEWNSDYDAPAELGWTDGTAWDGFYQVQVYAGSNYNGVNEQVRFSINIYKDGNLVLEEEHTVAEGSTWDDLAVAYP